MAPHFLLESVADTCKWRLIAYFKVWLTRVNGAWWPTLKCECHVSMAPHVSWVTVGFFTISPLALFTPLLHGLPVFVGLFPFSFDRCLAFYCVAFLAFPCSNIIFTLAIYTNEWAQMNYYENLGQKHGSYKLCLLYLRGLISFTFISVQLDLF